MKFFSNRNSSLFFSILAFTLMFSMNFSIATKIRKGMSKISFKNETILNQTLNNESNNSKIIQDFPLKIEINWNSIKDNFNLHLKRVEKGRHLNDHIYTGPYRVNNETFIKSQTMMLEKLVSGVYILYAEKFDSLESLNVSNTTVSIFSDKRSYYNVTCNTNYIENINWKKSVFWEIGKFEFFTNSVVFETLNFLTNEIVE